MKLIAILAVVIMSSCSVEPLSAVLNPDSTEETLLHIVARGQVSVVNAANSGQMSLQLIDSGFNYDSRDLEISGGQATVITDHSAQACFTGTVLHVCELLERMSAVAEENYEEGDHDLISLVSCEGNQSAVTFVYTMVTDYDAYTITANKKIGRCAE